MRNKKGFEMAMNTIVVLVLMLALFGVGMWLATKIFSSGTETIDLANEQLLSKYRDLSCGGGQPLCVSEKSFTLGYGEQKVVGVKITNRLDEKMNFDLSGSGSTESSPAGGAAIPLENTVHGLIVEYIDSPITLGKGESGSQLILIRPETTAVEGTYVLKLQYIATPTDGSSGIDLPPINIYVTVR